MPLTNKHDLPEVYVKAAEKRTYKGPKMDMGVTTVLSPPQMVQLRKRHDIEEDISERMWALLGQGVHKVLEEADPENSEVAFTTEIDGLTVGCIVDYVEEEEAPPPAPVL